MFLRSQHIFWKLLASHLTENGGTRVLIGSVQEELLDIILPSGKLEGNSKWLTSTISKENGQERTIIATSDTVLGGDLASEFWDRVIEILYMTQQQKTRYLCVHLEVGENQWSVRKLLFTSEDGIFHWEKIHGTQYFDLRLRKELWAFPWKKSPFSSQEKEAEGDIISTFPKQVKEAILSLLSEAYAGCDIIDDVFEAETEEWFSPRRMFLNIHEGIEKVKEDVV